MHQPAAGSTCPSCAEPLETGDLFCGACGYDLSAAPAPPRRPPTIGHRHAGRVADGERDGQLRQPAPVHRPGDLPGTDSGGGPLPASAVRYDGPPGAHRRSSPASRPTPRRRPRPAPRSSGGDFELRRARPGHRRRRRPARRGPRHAAVRHQGVRGLPRRPCRHRRLLRELRARPAPRARPHGAGARLGRRGQRPRPAPPPQRGLVRGLLDRPARRLARRRRDRLRRGVVGDPPRRGLAAAASAANEPLLESLPRGTHPQQAMHEAIVAASEAVNSLAADPARARRWSTIRTAIRTRPRARSSARSSQAACWSSAGSATAAPTGCPTTAAARPPGSPRTTPGPPRWWRRA